MKVQPTHSWRAPPRFTGMPVHACAVGADPPQAPLTPPEHRAAQEGKTEILQLLLERKTNPIDTKDSTGSTPLHWFLLLLPLQSQTPLLCPPNHAHFGFWLASSVRHRAADEGQTLAMQQLIDSGADVNAVDGEGETALGRAALAGHTDAIVVRIYPSLHQHNSLWSLSPPPSVCVRTCHQLLARAGANLNSASASGTA